MHDTIFDTADLQREADALQSEMAVTAELIQKCIDDNAHRAQDQDEYRERYGALVERFETAKARYGEVSELITDRKARRQAAEAFLSEVKKRKAPLDEFDEQFWHATVDVVMVKADGTLVFRFKDGTEIE
jgi:chromosome segregation ATPase